MNETVTRTPPRFAVGARVATGAGRTGVVVAVAYFGGRWEYRVKHDRVKDELWIGGPSLRDATPFDEAS